VPNNAGFFRPGVAGSGLRRRRTGQSGGRQPKRDRAKPQGPILSDGTFGVNEGMNRKRAERGGGVLFLIPISHFVPLLEF
jgi:hypothetical protein